MSRTLQQLSDMIRRRLGWPLTDAFVTDAELADMLRESRRELHDFLISVHGGDYNGIFLTFPTEAGRPIYVLSNDPNIASNPDLPTQVARIHRIALKINGRSIPMRRWDVDTAVNLTDAQAWDESTDIRYKLTFLNQGSLYIWFDPIPAGVYTVEIYFVPAADAVSFSATDAVNLLGHDEYLVLDCCAKCAEMEETDSTPFVTRRERFKEMLTNTRPPIDAGQAETIQDVRSLEVDRNIWRRW